MIIKGSIPALVTPFSEGCVDFSALKELVEWHVSQGTNGLVPVGTTGESPTLSHSEHDEVVATVVKAAGGRIPVIAGAGSNNTAETVRLIEAAKQSGATAALVVAPYYNKPTQDGVIAHFVAAAKVGLPIIVYNIPNRSVIDILPDTMGKLAEIPEIIGVKDATGDVTRALEQRQECGTDFIQLSGDDTSAVGFNAQGGVGIITVVGNITPALCAEIQTACLEGDYTRALEINARLLPLCKAITLEPALVGTKYALSLLGKIKEDVRLPLIPASAPTKEAIRKAMADLDLI